MLANTQRRDDQQDLFGSYLEALGYLLLMLHPSQKTQQREGRELIPSNKTFSNFICYIYIILKQNEY